VRRAARAIRNRDLFVRESCLERERKLIRTGCSAKTALCSLEFCDDVICLHAINEFGDSFGVAVAAADKVYIFNNTVLEIESDLS
jgi:hypothetical protein